MGEEEEPSYTKQFHVFSILDDNSGNSSSRWDKKELSVWLCVYQFQSAAAGVELLSTRLH
jgi:hypothetical protein